MDIWFSVVLICVIPHNWTHYSFERNVMNFFLKNFGNFFGFFFFFFFFQKLGKLLHFFVKAKLWKNDQAYVGKSNYGLLIRMTFAGLMNQWCIDSRHAWALLTYFFITFTLK